MFVEHWDKERDKLSKWERTGAVDKPKLEHLSIFMGKGQDSAAKGAVKVATEAEQDRRDLLSELRVLNPAFPDANAATMECERCSEMKPREEFTKRQLGKLADLERPEEEKKPVFMHGPNTKVGPYKGRVVRIQPYKHFAFIHSEAAEKELGSKQQVAFLHARYIEKFFGGIPGVRRALQSGKDEHMRVRFYIEFGKDMINDECKMTAVDVEKLTLLCKPCEAKQQKVDDELRVVKEERKQRELEWQKEQNVQPGGATVAFAMAMGTAVMPKMQGPIGPDGAEPPQVARPAPPVNIAIKSKKMGVGLGTHAVTPGFDPKEKLAGLMGTLGCIKGGSSGGTAPKVALPALPALRPLP